MALKHARPHIQRMKRHHDAHKKIILRLVHAIRKHPGAYRPGFKPSRAGVPKSFPRKPAGLHAEASGFFDFAKKGWDWIKSKFHQHKGKVVDYAKKVGSETASRVGSRVGAAARRVGSRVVDKIEQVAENNIDHYVTKAENKIDSMGKKAEAKLQKWDKPKKGSGVIMDSIGRNVGQAVRAYSQARRGRRRPRISTIQSAYRGPQTIGRVMANLTNAGRVGRYGRAK